MTAFTHVSLTAAGGAPIQPGYAQNRDNLQEPSYRTTEPYTDAPMQQEVDVLWTRSSVLGSGGQDGMSVGAGGIIQSDCQRWEWYWPPTGCHVRKKVSGVVVNTSGVAVANATVTLFNTASGVLVDTQVSASDGSFTCGDPNSTNCFAVADLQGSPETAGTTIQELTGV